MDHGHPTHGSNQPPQHTMTRTPAKFLAHRPQPKGPPLDVGALLQGKRFVVFGGTGFLGKVWLCHVLDRYADIDHLYLLVRSRKNQTSEQRFWSSIVTSDVLQTLRDKHGDGYEAFIKSKVTAIDGDVSLAKCGVDVSRLTNVDAVVNVSGVVDFDPPLDEALLVNAFGVQNLVDLSRALGNVPVLHTSTCYVAGNRDGQVDELDPREFPFPRADELDRKHWDPQREIAECTDLVKQARQRCDDAFRQSAFLDEAKANLEKRNEPTSGPALEEEYQKVRRKFVETQLGDAGMERAKFWGWPNTYTYTKSIGEQILAASGLRFTIVRPAIIESSLEYPFPGWNEGINTSAPLAWAIIQGLDTLPVGDRSFLDIIPVDHVSSAMILALAALLQDSHKPVYQVGTSDINGIPVKRIVELTGLFKRNYWDRHQKNPLKSFLMRRYEGVTITADEFEWRGVGGLAKATSGAASLLRAAGLPGSVTKPIRAVGNELDRNAKLIRTFFPFINSSYVFDCRNTRDLWLRATEEDQRRLPCDTTSIDWRHYWYGVHLPGLEKWIFKEIQAKSKRPLKQAKRHETLLSLLDDMADRHDLLVALQRLESDDGLTRITFREWRQRADGVANKLAAMGVKPGDRVFLSASNHPDWPIAYFGIMKAGAVAVPVDKDLDPAPFLNVLRSSEAKVALWDEGVEEKSGRHARAELPHVKVLDLHEFAGESCIGLDAPELDVKPSDLASLIYTSGTTGIPKGVMLTHANFTALLSSLSPLFPINSDDRFLSVLPLHHTFEFACGMLLPLSCGARIIYLDKVNGDRLATGLKAGRVTAMAGVPALWQLLERKIQSQAAEKGVVAEKYIEWGGDLNRWLGKKLDVDVGRYLFASVHGALGGNIKYLVSGAAALPPETQKFFAGLGLHMSEGYGLTEASPVLSVQTAGPRSKGGSVGKAIPGVELKILSPDQNGIGEVVARGPNVMLGYADNAEATKAVLDEGGWLHTGDLGKFDKDGRLSIVGRSKEVIVNASGENVYPDDVENGLGRIRHVEEYSICGIPDGANGERVAMLARPETSSHEDDDRTQRFERANKSLREAIEKLPMNQRPVVVQLYDAELPKTATRKMKRSEIKKIVERMVAASTPVEVDEGTASTPIRAVIARLAHKKPAEITGNTRFQGDLGFDSLMMMELVVALEQQLGQRALPDDLSRVETVGEAEKLLGEQPTIVKKRVEKAVKDEDLTLPKPVQDLAKRLLGRVQMGFYEAAMETKVEGRAYIPHNRPTIVIANHSSHLDMGLVKFALGDYGSDIVSLAAQDYFFEDKWKKAFFENFTNLAALDRKAGFAKALKQAGDIIDQGKTVLIFPEGTRSPDGALHEFKRSFAHLALTHEIDILPLYLRGTYQAMPKGRGVPSNRTISAHIGPPLRVSDLRRLTHGLSFADSVRKVAELGQRAVEKLRDGEMLDLSRVKPEEMAELEQGIHPMVRLFKELDERFVKGAVETPTSFYFTLGAEDEAKWNLVVTADSCVIKMGKPESGTADCVLKTNQDLFTRIVREGYVPGVDEFMAGTIKSNDVSLLATFSQAFNLSAS